MGVRAERAAKTRTQVVDAARKLFLAGGYERVTIRDIARSAGKSTGSVFCHFAGKEELFRECIGVEADVEAFMRHLIRSDDPGGLMRQKLAAFADAYFGVRP